MFENSKTEKMFGEEGYTDEELIPLFRHRKPIKSRKFKGISYILQDGIITTVTNRNY